MGTEERGSSVGVNGKLEINRSFYNPTVALHDISIKCDDC